MSMLTGEVLPPVRTGDEQVSLLAPQRPHKERKLLGAGPTLVQHGPSVSEATFTAP